MAADKQYYSLQAAYTFLQQPANIAASLDRYGNGLRKINLDTYLR